MFTGIIRNTGTLDTIAQEESGAVLLTIATDISKDLHEGDSVAVNGVCLTVLSYTEANWQCRLMAETLKKTTLGTLQVGDVVNIELPVRANEGLHGHIVQGHVDGTCAITAITPVGDDRIFTLTPGKEHMENITRKGSVALDGVSLTVVDVSEDSFTVSLMPYTLSQTTLGIRNVGDFLNIETDKQRHLPWVSGVVTPGDRRGSALGFPTANISLAEQAILPEGIFACRAMIEHDPTIYAGALHIGPRPTFPGAAPSVELHLLHFPPRDLYGETVSYAIVKKIRDVKKFDSAEDLVRAIQEDVHIATSILATPI